MLIEKERVGGTCLNVGCIPTRALTISTELLLKVKRAHEFGLFVTNVVPDLPALMNYKQETVDGLVGGVEHLLQKLALLCCVGKAA